MYSAPNLIPISYNHNIEYQLDDKNLFRLSINSHQSVNTASTSESNNSNRLSYLSNSNSNIEDENTTHSTSLKSRILNRFSHHQESHHNTITLKSVLENEKSFIINQWIEVYEVPKFTFSKVWKKRYMILINNSIYLFKSINKLSALSIDHFMLTKDTFVFLTEEFQNNNKYKGDYIIEVRKPYAKWFIRCECIQQMKAILNYLKKIVACIKMKYDGSISTEFLDSIILTDNYQIILPKKNPLYRQSLPTIQKDVKKPKRQSLQDIPNWQATLPPQLPPPKSKPPPVPHYLPTVTEDTT